MIRAAFPTITPDVARRYIATARLAPNAVAIRLRQMLARPVMHRVCMHCGCDLGDVPCSPAMAGKTSHGLCHPCAVKHYPEFADAGSLAGAGRPGDCRDQVYANAEAGVGNHSPGDAISPTPSLLRSSESYADAKDGMADGAGEPLSTVSLDQVQANEPASEGVRKYADVSSAVSSATARRDEQSIFSPTFPVTGAPNPAPA